jgi:hypothetical protein
VDAGLGKALDTAIRGGMFVGNGPIFNGFRRLRAHFHVFRLYSAACYVFFGFVNVVRLFRPQIYIAYTRSFSALFSQYGTISFIYTMNAQGVASHKVILSSEVARLVQIDPDFQG